MTPPETVAFPKVAASKMVARAFELLKAVLNVFTAVEAAAVEVGSLAVNGIVACVTTFRLPGRGLTMVLYARGFT